MGNISNSEMDICVEMHHGRKGKGMGTKFKGVVQGVLISAVITASVLGAVTPAYAANNATITNEASDIVSVYGVTFEQAMDSISETINMINDLKQDGMVSQSMLNKLASDISQLERAVDKTDFAQVTVASQILDSAESAVAGIQGNTNVVVAISVARQSLGIETASFNVKQAKAAVKSFDDVPSGHWAYDKVMRAVELGLFQGTREPDANGVGHFNVTGTMTRAEFLTVCMRAAGVQATNYQNPNGGKWYDGTWDAAVKKGIISSIAFGGLDYFGEPITREEMAYLAVQTLAYKGEKATNLIDVTKIPDFKGISDVYVSDVQKCYSMGILCGVDLAGTFNPSDVLTRGQAATVCVRLLDKSAREDTSKLFQNQSVASHEWHEGEKHELAQAGDVVIKADGTKVVLQEIVVAYEAGGQPIKVLGVGQGVDIWTGTVIIHKQTGAEIVLGVGSVTGGWYRASDTSKVEKHGYETHTAMEWTLIENLPGYTKPTEAGRYVGEIKNHIWQWHEGLYNAETGYQDEGFWALRDAIN